MAEKVYGIWLPEQRPPGWWIDASGVPFHTPYRCVAMALLCEKKECDGDIEIIGKDGRPERGMGDMTDVANWARSAYRSMAESMKKGVVELSTEERQQALLNAMLERDAKKPEPPPDCRC